MVAEIDPAATGNLVNTAVVTAPAGVTDPNPGDNQSTDIDSLGGSTDLSVVKTDDPDPVVAGETLTYTLLVSNAGPSASTGGEVIDTLPSAVTLVSASAGCIFTAPSTVTCSFGALTVGDSTSFTITCDVDSSATGPLSNTAVVVGNEGNPDPDDNTDIEPTDVVRVADLAVVKTGPGSIVTPATLAFTLAVSNLGPSDASGVTVTDPTPAGLSFVSASAPCGAGFPCTIGDLAAGASIVLTVTYQVPAGYTTPDPIVNTASVAGNETDPDPGNNTSSSATAVNREPSADLQVVKSGPPSAAVGSTVTYTIVVSNLGPDDAQGVVLADPTPAGLAFVSASAPCGGGFPCSLGLVNAGASVTVAVTFSIPLGYLDPSVTNVATVTSTTPDPEPGNNSDEEITPIGADPADLAVVKTGPTSVVPGSDLTYTVVVTNLGPAQATGVTLSDPTPVGLTFVSASAPCAAGFPCILGDLAVGASVTVTVTFNVPGGYTTPNPIVNTATVAGAEPDPNPSNNTDDALTGVGAAAADVGVVKSGPAEAAAGSDVTYVITVTSYGPDTATAVSLADPTPVGLVFVSASAPCAAGFPCALGDLAAGSAVTVSVTFHIPSGYTAPDPIVNVATVSTTAPDGDPSNDSDPATTALGQAADLSITKDDGVASVLPGTSTTYTITVVNAGPSDAVGATVSDVFPPEITSATWTCVASAGSSCTAGPVVGDINDTVTVLAGGNLVYTVVAEIDPAATGNLVNTAVVTPPAGITDPNPGDNQSTDIDSLGGSTNLSVVKTDDPDPVVAGETLTYTLLVSNAGPSASTGGEVIDTLPSAVTFVSASAGCFSPRPRR